MKEREQTDGGSSRSGESGDTRQGQGEEFWELRGWAAVSVLQEQSGRSTEGEDWGL